VAQLQPSLVRMNLHLFIATTSLLETSQDAFALARIGKQRHWTEERFCINLHVVANTTLGMAFCHRGKFLMLAPMICMCLISGRDFRLVLQQIEILLLSKGTDSAKNRRPFHVLCTEL